LLPGKSNPPSLDQIQTYEILDDFDPTGTNTNEEGGKSNKISLMFLFKKSI